MALATFGIFESVNPEFGAKLGAIFRAIDGPLGRFKAQYGTPQGTSVTLDNGTVGHFDSAGQFYIDNAGPAAAAVPSNTAPFTTPPAYPPTYLPTGAAPVPSRAPVPAGAPAAAPSFFGGIPPIALAAAGGLALFLIARRL